MEFDYQAMKLDNPDMGSDNQDMDTLILQSEWVRTSILRLSNTWADEDIIPVAILVGLTTALGSLVLLMDKHGDEKSKELAELVYDALTNHLDKSRREEALRE